MPLTQYLEKFNEKAKPYYTLFIMMAFFLTTGIAIYKFIVRPQDLSVIIQKQEVNFPNSINEKYTSVYKFLNDSINNKAILTDAYNVYTYLQNTNNFWTVKLKNETDKSIKGIRLKITDVSSLNAWGISGPFLLAEENDKLLKSLKFQETSGIITLDRVEVLPPKEELKIYIWGKLPALALDENVIVNYEEGDAAPGKETVVSGFKAYVCDFIYEIFLVIFLVFTGVYVQLVKKYTRVTS